MERYGYFSCAVIGLLLWANSCFAKQDLTFKFYGEAFPPFLFLDENRRTAGVYNDIAEEILKRTRSQGRVIITPIARAAVIVGTDENSFLLAMLKTKEREDQFQWLGVTHQIKGHLIALASRPELKVASLDQAKPYLIGTVRGHAVINYLEHKGFQEGVHFVLTADNASLWNMLFSRRIDYVMNSLAMARYKSKQLGYDSSELVGVLAINDMSKEMHLAAGPITDQVVAQEAADALQALKLDGTYQDILKKWQVD